MENTKKFFEELIRTQEAKEILSAYEKPQNEEEVAEIYVETAEKMGVEITKDSVLAYLTQNKNGEKLDDRELEQLTGGEIRICHDTYSQRENCIWNDGCDTLVNDYDDYICSWNDEGICKNLAADGNGSFNKRLV